jgi:hypothetical protein
VIRYARFHLAADTAGGGDAGIVSPESLLQMREPVMDFPGLPMSIGRNCFEQNIGGVRVFQHNGDTAGQHTEFIVIPEHDFAFVLLTNSTGGAAAAMDALDAALATYPGLGDLAGKVGLSHVSMADPDAPAVDLSPEVEAEYVGRYADLGTAYTIADTTDGLTIGAESIIQPGTWQTAIMPADSPPIPLEFRAKDEGVLYGVARMPFVRDAAGDVGWLSAGLRLIPLVDED